MMTQHTYETRDRSRRPDAKARTLARRNARRAKPATLAFLAIAFGGQ